MNNIEFRVWDENSEKMFFVSRADFFCDGIDIVEVKSYCNSDLEARWSGNSKNIMQYTGLKDKLNKNKVYEHDIINHIQYGFLKVVWDYSRGAWACVSKVYKRRYYLADVLNVGGIRVGNIFENEDLLK